MLINISPSDLKDRLHSIQDSQQRRSISGMLKSGDLDGRISAVRFLQKQGIVNVDWTYQCQCGVCDPEILVS